MSITIMELEEIVGKTQTREEAEEGIAIDTEFVAVPYAEYHNLVACETLLDVVIESKNESNSYYSDQVIQAVAKVRRRYLGIAEDRPDPEPKTEGGGSGE